MFSSVIVIGHHKLAHAPGTSVPNSAAFPSQLILVRLGAGESRTTHVGTIHVSVLREEIEELFTCECAGAGQRRIGGEGLLVQSESPASRKMEAMLVTAVRFQDVTSPLNADAE